MSSLQQGVAASNANVANLLDQIAGVDLNLGQQQYQWAQSQFANNSVLTDQAVNNYLTASQQAMQLAGNNIDRYEQVFQPLENQLISDANSYASAPRVALEMGQAETGTGQAMDQGRINAEQNLESFGIDPSSGRYAELEQAQQAQKAAAQAGAGQAARYNTEQTGRALRSQAIQVGQQYPGQAVNALNSAVQSLSGAVNAKLANTNTGVNAFNSADAYLNSAGAAGKFQPYPPNQPGTVLSSSTGASRTGGGGGTHVVSGGGGGGGYMTPTGGGGIDTQDQQPNYQTDNNFGGYGGNYPSPLITSVNPDAAGYDVSGGYTDNGFYGPQYNFTDPTQSSYFNDASNSYNNFNGDWSNPSTDYSSGFSDYSQQPANYSSSGYNDFSTPSSDFNSYSTPSDNSYSGSDYNSGDSGGAYAQGGAIPAPGQTPGGGVPPQASPSMGRQTDDVHANLTAGEFVVPKDVAAWKGQEFFQKLIEQSRKSRMGASAKGQPGPAPRGPVRFASRPQGA